MLQLLLAFSLQLPGGAPSRAPADAWLAPDKAKHFFVSAFAQSIGYSVLRTAGLQHSSSLAGASVGTLALGVGREVHDRRVGRVFSPRDLVWDAAGAGAATLLLNQTVR